MTNPLGQIVRTITPTHPQEEAYDWLIHKTKARAPYGTAVNRKTREVIPGISRWLDSNNIKIISL